jgi:hypothetical protein
MAHSLFSTPKKVKADQVLVTTSTLGNGIGSVGRCVIEVAPKKPRRPRY